MPNYDTETKEIQLLSLKNDKRIHGPPTTKPANSTRMSFEGIDKAMFNVIYERDQLFNNSENNGGQK